MLRIFSFLWVGTYKGTDFPKSTLLTDTSLVESWSTGMNQYTVSLNAVGASAGGFQDT